jgi:hypothetical protein
MISKEKLLEHLRAIITFEEDMKNEYEELIGGLHVRSVADKLKPISDWETRHVRLARDLVEMVENEDFE